MTELLVGLGLNVNVEEKALDVYCCLLKVIYKVQTS